MSADREQASGWPVTMRDLLAAVTALGIAVAGPLDRQRNTVGDLVRSLVFTLPLVLTVLAALPAWRILKARALDGATAPETIGKERFAFTIGVLAMLPYAVGWSMFMYYPPGPHPAVIDSFFTLIGFAAFLAYIPLLLGLLYSLEASWGYRSNLPLLMLRLMALLAYGVLALGLAAAIAGSD